MITNGKGMVIFGRLSVSWNFHQSRQHRTIALPLAISVDDRGVYVFFGPITFLWIRSQTVPDSES